MAIYRVATFDVREGHELDAEKAMHELASLVRKELPKCAWTSYRDRDHGRRYIAIIVADDARAAEQYAQTTRALVSTLESHLVAPLESSQYELVTSSNLAPRRR